MTRPLALYIHIPFCVKKCNYCDFLSFPSNEEMRKEYVDALKAEIVTESKAYKDYTVTSIFIGGGTPSVLKQGQIASIVSCIYESFNVATYAEVTIECNPGTVDALKLAEYKRCGVNRISFGLQSAINSELALLGRIHTFEEYEESIKLARSEGFDNINTDIMLSLPGQHLTDVRYTLEKVLANEPRHISAYSLIIEEGTPFFDKYKDGEGLPEDEEDRRIYAYVCKKLADNGYAQYEISNFALPGYESKHNIVYWKRGDYLGMGLGASSMVGNVRWKNTAEISKYISNDEIKCDIIKLDVRERMEEFMFLGLRMNEGVDTDKFSEIFGISFDSLDEYTSHTDKMICAGLLERMGAVIRLTDKGRDLANTVFAGYLFE